MLVNYIYKCIWFAGLVLLQVLILNNIHFFGYATPFLYVYLILKFEPDTSRGTLLIWAFLLGLVVDIFCDTLGVNAAATTLLGFLQPYFLRLYTPRDLLETYTPSIGSLGIGNFLKYAVTCVAIHHFVLLSLEYFSFNLFGTLLLRILSCTLLTVACVLALESISKKNEHA